MVICVSAASASGTTASVGPPGICTTPPSGPMVAVVAGGAGLEVPPHPISKARTGRVVRARMVPPRRKALATRPFRTASGHSVASQESDTTQPSGIWWAFDDPRIASSQRPRRLALNAPDVRAPPASQAEQLQAPPPDWIHARAGPFILSIANPGASQSFGSRVFEHGIAMAS